MLANRNTYPTARANTATKITSCEPIKDSTRTASELNTIRPTNKIKTPAQDPVYDFVGVAG